MCPQDHQTQSTSHPAFHLIEKENIKFYGTSWFKGHPSLLRLQCNFLCHTDLWICTLFCSSHVNFKCNTVIPTNTNTTHTRKKQCEAAAHCDSYLTSMYVITLLVLPCQTNTDHYADSHESHATQTQNRHAGLHTHTCTHVHTHTHIHTNMCAHMNMHTHTHMNTHCVCVCVQNKTSNNDLTCLPTCLLFLGHTGHCTELLVLSWACKLLKLSQHHTVEKLQQSWALLTASWPAHHTA